MARSRVRTPAFVLMLVLVLAAAGSAGYFETRALRHHAGPSAAPSRPVPAALTEATAAPSELPPPATSGAGDAPRPALVARALRTPLASSALGSGVLAHVVDVATGRVLLDRHGATPGAPASTAKLLTATAALAVLGPGHRITTSVVAGRDGTVVLVGGGDPTLTAAAKGRPGAYADAARIGDLAAQLTQAHVQVRRIVVDGALFTGPAVSPRWAPEDVPSSYASAITALMADGGRAAPGDTVRSATPDLAAGHALAAALGRPGLPVSRGRAPAGATVLAHVRSAPVSELVEQMLQQSDNVIAECLGRLVAVAQGRPGSFTGAAAAIRSVLAGLGVRVGAGMHDASGLAASDRLAPATLTAVLRLDAGGADPVLHTVLAGLPVAGWSGTLADRYLGGAAATGAGTVRAKTGTLSGVSALAGLVHDRSGQLLAFALLAEQVPSNAAADAGLDRVAAALARCGCS